jgi:hypothetical protein
MALLAQGVRNAFRMPVWNVGVAVVAALELALGTAPNATMFSGALVVAGAGFLAVETAEQAGSKGVLEVVINDGAGVPAELLRSARQEAARILEQAGVASRWRDCFGDGGRTPSVCTEPLTPSRLIVRIARLRARVFQRTPIGAGDAVEILGDAMCIRGAGGHYGTIYYGSIERLAGGSQLRMARVLGYVIAHEIGHLLLGPQHTGGVMAPHCRAGEILKVPPEQCLFTAGDGEKMLAQVRRRTGAQIVRRDSLAIH